MPRFVGNFLDSPPRVPSGAPRLDGNITNNIIDALQPPTVLPLCDSDHNMLLGLSQVVGTPLTVDKHTPERDQATL